MNCPTCGLKGAIKESRPDGDGTMRRYTCARLHKWKTSEQLVVVYDDAYVKARQHENGKRLAAVAIAKKSDRLARGDLSKVEIDAARRARARAFKEAREAEL